MIRQTSTLQRQAASVLLALSCAGCDSGVPHATRKKVAANDKSAVELIDLDSTIPPFTPHTWNPHGLAMTIDDGGAAPVDEFEITPMVLGQDGRDDIVFVLPGMYTRLCVKAANIATAARLDFGKGDCTAIALPTVESGLAPDDKAWFYPPEDVAANHVPWRDEYAGLFGMERVNGGIFFVGHGESENAAYVDAAGKSFLYQSAIASTIPTDACHSGYDGKGDEPSGPTGYAHCWKSFNSFGFSAFMGTTGALARTGGAVTGLKTPLVQDLGPIFWEPGGYHHRSGDRLGTHPTLFRNGDNMYAFTSGPNPTGKGYFCTTAAQAPIPPNGLVTPDSWRLLDSNGGFTQPSLPPGFSATSIDRFLDVSGNQPTCLFPDEDVDHGQTIFFNVARLFQNGKFTGFFAGIYTRTVIDPAPGRNETVIRLSRDLIHWSAPQLVFPSAPGDWTTNYFNYPVMVSKEGTSTHDIDVCNFAIMGKHPPDPKHVQVTSASLEIQGLASCSAAAAPAAAAPAPASPPAQAQPPLPAPAPSPPQPLGIAISVNGQDATNRQIPLKLGTPADIWMACDGPAKAGKLTNNLPSPWTSNGTNVEQVVPGNPPAMEIHYWGACWGSKSQEAKAELDVVWTP